MYYAEVLQSFHSRQTYVGCYLRRDIRFAGSVLQINERCFQRSTLSHVCCGPEVGKEPETGSSGFDTCLLVHSPYLRSPFHRIYACRECPNLPRHVCEVNVDDQGQLVQYELVFNFFWNASWRHCPPAYTALASSVELTVSIDILCQSDRHANC